MCRAFRSADLFSLTDLQTQARRVLLPRSIWHVKVPTRSGFCTCGPTGSRAPASSLAPLVAASSSAVTVRLSILAPGECDFVSNHRWLSPPVLVGTQAPAAARIALLVLASMVRVVMSIPQHPPRAQTSEERLDSPGDRRRCVAFSWPLPWRCRKGARGSSYNPYFIPCSVDPCSCSPHTLPFTPLRGPCEH